MKLFITLLLPLALILASIGIGAHHGVPAEYGNVTGPSHRIEGKVIDVKWMNPHVFINIETTGGEVEAGEKWRLTTHPIHILENTYNIHKDDFKVGDHLKIEGWFHVRGQPLMQLRAIQVNDGPLRSTLRFADMRDIVNGHYKTSNILPPKTLHGANPGRSGKETVAGLKALGYLDDAGNVKLPDDFPVGD